MSPQIELLKENAMEILELAESPSSVLNRNIEDSGYITAKKLLALNTGEITWLWDLILPKNGVALLTGPSDSNKSTFINNLAIAIVSGNNTFLGRQLNPSSKTALLIITEDSKTSTAAILRKQEFDKASDDIQESLAFRYIPVQNPTEIENIIKEIKPSFVGLDTWSDCFNGDLNSTISVRQNLLRWKAMADKYDFLVLGIHHSKKGSEEMESNKSLMLGSQGLEAFSRVVLEIRRSDGNDSNRRKLQVVKGNYIPDELKKRPIMMELNPEKMQLNLVETSYITGQPIPREYSEDSKKMLSSVIKRLNSEGNSQDQIVEELKRLFPDTKTPSKGTVNTWLTEMKQAEIQVSIKETT